ncbi:hypothetical protein KC360_g214 [Hortaea werneckii]|nr:hypothetical protein KC344_g218 [Hortaea werneckii]KAI7180413.1 hypothetical protein KC360_g214 [Hortaea werneckii]
MSQRCASKQYDASVGSKPRTLLPLPSTSRTRTGNVLSWADCHDDEKDNVCAKSRQPSVGLDSEWAFGKLQLWNGWIC